MEIIKRYNWRTYILALLLGVQVMWICTHLLFVYKGEINPWKFGGYGMYTVPKPFPTVEVSYQHRLTGDTLLVFPLETKNYLRSNWDYNWACIPASENTLNHLWRDNPQLRGMNMTVTVSEERFNRLPITLIPYELSRVVVTWQDPVRYTFTQYRCGKEGVTRQGIFNE